MSLLSNKELEERLNATGNSLLQPPTSLDELLTLLDQTEELLSKVEQSPAKSMQTALSLLMKALVSEELLKHSDVDVKVGVASCISEVTRITAPDAPYDDDKMKDVFQLIVSSFENLSDTSSRSHEKRATILETVAKVRSCVIMLDLEWDQMIIEMFQHFLKSIRLYHSEVIFASMEIIMTLVLEESEDISTDLLNPILETLKRNNEEVLPIAKKLAERVIQNCADKLRPYLAQAVNTLDASLDDYSEVVASVCQKNTGTVGHNDEKIYKIQLVDKRKSTSASPVRPPVTQAAKDGREEINPQNKDPAVNGSPKSIVSNSIKETGAEEARTNANYLKKEETMTNASYLKKAESNQQFDAKSTSKTDSDDLGAQKSVHLEAKVEHVDEEKQAEQGPYHREIPSKEINISPGEVPPVEAAEPLDKVKDTTIQLSPSKEHENEAVNVASPTQSGSLSDEDLSKRSGRAKMKENLAQEETESTDTSSKKASEGANISEANKQQRMVKIQHDEITVMDKALTEGVSKNGAGCTSDSEARHLDPTEKLGDASNKTEYESLLKEDGKRGGRVKPRFQKDTLKYSAREDHVKDTVASPRSPFKSTNVEVNQDEIPRISSKRKQTPGTDNTSETIEYGENLVGSKVRVWWPKDRMFYEGVIASFDSVRKKHKVLYDDGDKEVLNLRRERWEFVEDDSVSEEGLIVEHSSHDASSIMQRKKKDNANSETSSKHGRMEDPPGSKLKDNARKYGYKSKDDGKAKPKHKDDYAEFSGNSEDETGEVKDHSQKLEGKYHDNSAKASGRTRDVDVARTSSHSKQDILQTAKSKGKAPQSGKTVSPNGTRRKKSSSSKMKEIDRMKEKTRGMPKSPETVKSVKSRESGTKSGKKRRR